jgi:16S rRNA (cytidine1402-2'-O)-methyltransferase
VGTLYVVSAPAGDPNDLTRRALRILETVPLVIVDDQRSARALLDHHDIATGISPASGNGHLDALADGDVAYLLPGLSPVVSDAGYRLVRQALDAKCPVVPVPGPSFPITALVLSGLPADSFVYLGELPQDPVACRELLTVTSFEPGTILAQVSRALLPAALSDLHSTLGDRPMVLVAPSATGAQVIWRGRLGQDAAVSGPVAVSGVLVLVIGGAPVGAGRWDEGRLKSRIQDRLVEGMGAKEISRQLAGASGWPRREIYRLAVELAQRGATIGS